MKLYCNFNFILLQYKVTQYNTLNIKSSSSQLSKLKKEIKNGPKVTLNLSSNVTGNSSDETNFTHKLLLTNTQVLTLCKSFELPKFHQLI